MGSALAKLKSLFFSSKLEVVLLGLENSGKTTFVNYLEMGHPEEVAPTVGLEVKQVKKEGVQFKLWDIGGQERYRSEWGRYARGCDVVVFLVDTQAPKKLATVRKELHQLLEDPELARTPLLILANKIDLGPKISEQEMIKGLNLDYISTNPWLVIPISARVGTNVDQALEFLVEQSKT